MKRSANSNSLACILLAVLIPFTTACEQRKIPVGESGVAKADQSSTEVPGVGYSFPVKGDKYEILGIETDNKEQATAKTNAEGALNAHPDIACMVGLWAYNPPAILSALRSRNMVGKVKVVGFDEHSETLAGISDGTVHGTIVQQPYLFGFKSVEYLAAIARGSEVDVPNDKMIYVDHQTIKADNVQEFKTTVDAIMADNGPVPSLDSESYDLSNSVDLMFLTNSVDPFWVLAKKGCEKANAELNASCEVVMPSDASTESQKTAIEQFINRGGQGLAISPINAEDQVGIINQAAENMAVICQDSDSPASNRKFYLGTSNYLAGRAAGKLVKEAIPGGGKVMIFVGKLEVLNAQERSRGVIDELLDKPLPTEFVSN